MVKNLKASVALSMLLLSILIIAIAVGYQLKKMTGFGISLACSGNINIISEDSTFRAAITYSMENNDGLMNVEGGVYENGKRTALISLKRSFNWQANDDFILFTATPDSLLDIGNTDPALLNRFLPPFFLSNSQRELALRIRKINSQQYVFMSANTPYFICTKD